MMFRETLKKCMYVIWEAKDEYRLPSSLGGWIENYYGDSWMPNYAKNFWNKFMKKNDKINYFDMQSLDTPCLEWSYEE